MQIQGIYAIIDPSLIPTTPVEQAARNYLEAGIKLIQLRNKTDKPSTIIQQAQSIMTLKKQYNFLFIINDSPEIALEVNADGVHLGQQDMPVPQARKMLGFEKYIGLSSHSLREAEKAQNADIDYLAVGAIFPSPTKGPDHKVVGLDLLREVVQFSRVPVVAIGGINRANFNAVKETKVSSIALISALIQEPDMSLSEARHFVAACA